MPAETPTPTVDSPAALYVLKHGEMFGPFQEAQLQQGLKEGHFSPDDFVQIEGQEVWHPMGRILGMDETNLRGAVAPDWNSILKWAWFRLRYNIGEQSLTAGSACLAIGTLSLTLSHWPFVFWLPWFGVAVVCAIPLLRRKRETHGVLLLVGVVCIPFLFFIFGPRNSSHGASTTSDATAATAKFTPEPRLSPPPAMAEAKPEARDAGQPTVPQPAAPQSAPSEPAPDSIPGMSNPKPVTPHYATVPTESSPSTVEPPKRVVENIRLPEAPPRPALGQTPIPKPEVDLIREHRDALAIVKGNEGSGSAFICKVGNGTTLFTNIHVVADLTAPTISRIDGVPLVAGAADVAAGRDIARFVLSQPSAHPLEIITDFDNNVQMGDDVVVLGNSGGGGVVTKISGKIIGIGPDRIEVSAEFIPGNSGSPIIHVKTGQVIGIATYLTRRYEEFSSNQAGAQKTSPGTIVIRRFGYRLDNASTWEPLEWNEFRAEGVMMAKVSALTGDIFDFFASLRSKKEPSFATETLRRPAMDWLGSLQNKHLSDADRLSATRGFLNSLRFMVRSDINAAASRLRYTYFREELKKESHVRDELYKGFDEGSATLSEPSNQPTAVRKSH